jgi:predicted nucleotidyltransferase
MLEIFNNLKPFFEDNYREYGVREFAKEISITPPTASKLLKHFESNKLLQSRKYRNLLLFSTNRESLLFQDLQRSYYRVLLDEIIEKISIKSGFRTIILFGSVIYSSLSIKSDIDIYVNCNRSEIIETIAKNYSKSLKKIELHFIDELSNEHLKKNIQKGVILRGDIDELDEMQRMPFSNKNSN